MHPAVNREYGPDFIATMGAGLIPRRPATGKSSSAWSDTFRNSSWSCRALSLKSIRNSRLKSFCGTYIPLEIYCGSPRLMNVEHFSGKHKAPCLVRLSQVCSYLGPTKNDPSRPMKDQVLGCFISVVSDTCIYLR